MASLSQHSLNSSSFPATAIPAGSLEAQLADFRESYRTNGYGILRGVFSAQEVKEFRAECDRKGQLSYLTLRDFSSVLLDDRLLAAMRAILGDPVVYYGDSTSRSNDVVGGLYPKWYARHYHSDSRVEDYDYTKPYELARAGLYLHDTTNCSGGLKLRPGSHVMPCPEQLGIKASIKIALKNKSARFVVAPGPNRNVATMPGDVVVWNLRLHHAGYAVRMKGMPNLTLPPYIENLLPESMHLKSPDSRSVMFLTYGAQGRHTDNMIRNRWRNRDMRRFWLEQAQDTEMVALAKSKGVDIRFPDPA